MEIEWVSRSMSDKRDCWFNFARSWDEQGRFEHWEIWADALSAWAAIGGDIGIDDVLLASKTDELVLEDRPRKEGEPPS